MMGIETFSCEANAEATPTPHPSPQGGGGIRAGVPNFPLPLVGRGEGWGCLGAKLPSSAAVKFFRPTWQAQSGLAARITERAMGARPG